jgi:hypothetical protein
MIIYDIDEVMYEGMGGNVSTRDEKLKRILESTESYQKVNYFTPDKLSLKNKGVSGFIWLNSVAIDYNY